MSEPLPSSGSISFDRAVPWYDASRGTDDANTLREVDLVAEHLAGYDRVVEVGAGTGAICLRLHERGFRMTAVDVSMPMLLRLVDRAGGRAPFALVQADATRSPFADDAFDAAVARWVFHLIPNWTEALAEVARVVRSGGMFLINTGGVFQGPWAEVRSRLGEEVGRELRPIGLTWQDFDALDAATEALGLRPRVVPHLTVHDEEPLEEFLRGIEQNHYSWVWPLSDAERVRGAAAVRTWAEERYGPLDRPMPSDVEVIWRGYEVP